MVAEVFMMNPIVIRQIAPRLEVADRMRSRKPNLFVIGAMKSGTNYLRKLLNAHPAIFMCEPGEPNHFVEPRQLKTIWTDMWKRGFWQSEQHYLELFRRCRHSR
jgi:sulfotransferase family protein